ncbi:MAG TPA: Ig-like domain-containing protein, partial [Lacipirellulaceae bacterium]|nr:Ig-like domain-containing protein [Lacipirellulaceae bacterium]
MSDSSHSLGLRARNRRRRRRLQIELLESRYVLSGQALLTNDYFSLHENGPQMPLAVLANDSFDADYAGAKQITSVSFGSQGGRLAISADKHQVLYAPPADFAGSETFTYAVDGQFTAQVQVDIQSPLAPDQFNVVPDGAPHTLNVLANDPFWAGYTGARNITSVSVTNRGGTVSIAPDHKSVLYTAPTEAVGDDTFTYVVDGHYQTTVTVESPFTLVNDLYDVVKHDPPTTLAVMANDPFWAGYTGDKRITQVESSGIGANIQISGDGHSLIYTQPTDFGDKDFDSGILDTFHYVVDGKYDATVTVVLHRPVKDDYLSVDENSTGLFYDVTLNDRYGNYGDWEDNEFDVIDRVTSVTQSEHGGTVTISADGQGILYSPAAGFIGDDPFTYIADGVHAAHVFVHVTQPVHDDEFSAGVYQDTPNAVLDVLSNDFVGNGYAGPRLITAVGPTAHGGTVAIRADGKAILYTPAPGYIGGDHFTYTVDGELQANVNVQVAALAQNDWVSEYPDAEARPYTFNVLANDNFHQGYAGAGVLTSVELVGGGGQASIVNGQIVFDPTSAGTYTLRYTVDGQYQATLSVTVMSVANPDQAVVDENSVAQPISVLDNDFFNYLYPYSGPRLITAVTQSQHGGAVTVAADGHSLSYAPPIDFFGTDTFTYTLDNFM